MSGVMFLDPEYLEDMKKGGGGARLLSSDEVAKRIQREKEFFSISKRRRERSKGEGRESACRPGGSTARLLPQQGEER